MYIKEPEPQYIVLLQKVSFVLLCNATYVLHSLGTKNYLNYKNLIIYKKKKIKGNGGM